MKKALFLYAILFALTMLVPVIVCFTDPAGESDEALASIFRQCITLLGDFR